MIINKIKMITPSLSLINNIGTPPNSPIIHTLSITDSGAYIHLTKKATTKMDPVIMSKDTTERLLDGRTTE